MEVIEETGYGRGQRGAGLGRELINMRGMSHESMIKARGFGKYVFSYYSVSLLSWDISCLF